LSVSTIESKLRSLQSELERLNKSLEQEEKKELSYVSSIGRTEKSITKNTSLSALKTKQKSISGYKDKVNASKKKQSEIKVKISKKQTEIAKKQTELQKEQNKVFADMAKKQDQLIDAQRQLTSNIAATAAEGGQIMDQKEYDFFISHASEDKAAIAEPLAEALIAKGAKVWYDKFTLSVGDSLRESIDSGLAHSRFGIVILSEIYFKKFWTGKELNGLFAKQEDGQKVILPVWHNVSKDIVKQHSPILADMLALKSADFTVDELADEFFKLL
jgi:hypothetical protein